MANLPQRTGLSPFSLFDRDLDDVFEGFFRPMRTSQGGVGSLIPAMDVTEHDDSYVVHAELPGFDKDDIHVNLEHGRLTIVAESSRTTDEAEAKAGKPVIRERRYGRYSRTLNVGDEVSADDIKASYTDGVLEIVLPKRQPEPPASKRIAID